MALNLFGVDLLGLVDLALQPRNAPYGVKSELVAIDVVEHAHIEGRGCRALFLVSTHMDVVVIVPAVSEPVNAPWVAVESKDHRHANREKFIELFIGKPMRMLRGWLEGHEVDHVDHA